MRLLGHVLDRHGPATTSHEEGETLGVERIVRQPVQLLLLHLAAAPAVDAPNLQLQVDPHVPARQIAHSAHLAVVPGAVDAPTGAARRFFPRRCRRMTRAFGSPKMPRTVGAGRKPGKRYASHKRRCFRIRHHARCLDPQNSPVSVERPTFLMLFSPTRQDEEPEYMPIGDKHSALRKQRHQVRRNEIASAIQTLLPLLQEPVPEDDYESSRWDTPLTRRRRIARRFGH